MSQVAVQTDASTMLAMKAYRPGVEARRAILKELRRRELAGEPAPSIVELKLLAGGAYRHVRTMRDAGLLTTRRGNKGYIALTDAGRIAADSSL